MASRRVPTPGASVQRGGGLLRRVRALLGGRSGPAVAEVAALRARRDALAARLEEERRAFGERGRVYRQYPVGQGRIALPEVERRLANLYRVRLQRLEADLAACRRALAALVGTGEAGD